MIRRLRNWAPACAVTLLACSSSDESPSDEPLGASGVIFSPDGDGAGTPEPEGSGSGLGEGEGCVGQSAGTEAVPSILQLLVDTSGSMTQRATGSNRSKWRVTRDALINTIDGMPGTTSVGLLFYPDQPNDRAPCLEENAEVVAAPLGTPGSRQRQALTRAFGNQDPEGGTPTHDAFELAVRDLEAVQMPGERFLILITDGNPTYSLGCRGTGLVSDPVDPSPLVGAAASALARGIKTFVIGSPGSEDARVSLSRMARAGGTAAGGCSDDGPNFCHFDMTREDDFDAALQQALSTIAGLALSCTYDVPEPPSGGMLEPGKVNVVFTPTGLPREVIGQASEARCLEGWRYASNGTQVALCSQTCDRVKDYGGQLSLEFGCQTSLIR